MLFWRNIVCCATLWVNFSSVKPRTAVSITATYDMYFTTVQIAGGFKGPAGSVRSIMCHPSLPLVASAGLDRHAWVHNLDGSQVAKVKKNSHPILYNSRFIKSQILMYLFMCNLFLLSSCVTLFTVSSCVTHFCCVNPFFYYLFVCTAVLVSFFSSSACVL